MCGLQDPAGIQLRGSPCPFINIQKRSSSNAQHLFSPAASWLSRCHLDTLLVCHFPSGSFAYNLLSLAASFGVPPGDKTVLFIFRWYLNFFIECKSQKVDTERF